MKIITDDDFHTGLKDFSPEDVYQGMIAKGYIREFVNQDGVTMVTLTELGKARKLAHDGRLN